MTIREAQTKYGLKSYITNQGDSLLSVVDNIYGNRDSLYFYIITELNPHIDWCPVSGSASTLLPYGVEVFYLPVEICSQVYEVTG